MNKKEPKNKFVNVYKDHCKEYYLTKKKTKCFVSGWFLGKIEKIQ